MEDIQALLERLRHLPFAVSLRGSYLYVLDHVQPGSTTTPMIYSRLGIHPAATRGNRYVTRALILCAAVFAQDMYAEPLTLIKNATVIDGTGKAPRTNVDIFIQGRLIKKIEARGKSAQKSLPAGSRIVDATGLFIIPGLIDAHVHLRSVPGAVHRPSTDADIAVQRKHQLRAYLAAGVTAVLDAAAPANLRAELNQWKRDGIPMPAVYLLSPFLTPAGGYFGTPELQTRFYRDMWPGIEGSGQIESHLKKGLLQSPVGVKVTMEPGFGPIKVWPVFDSEQLDKISTASKKYGLPIYVHCMGPKEFERGLRLSPHAFVHSGFPQHELTDELAGKIKNSGAYVVTTVGLYELMNLMWRPEALRKAWFTKLVPREQIVSASDPRVTKKTIATIARLNSPTWVPDFLAKFFARFFFTEATVRAQEQSALAAVRKMHAAGIPLVAGSDSGNWPIWTTLFHGVGMIVELETLNKAGLPPMAVLQAATLNAATMVGVAHERGTIQTGKIADLVLLKGNPLEDMTVLRNPFMIFKDGVGKTPDQWLNK